MYYDSEDDPAAARRQGSQSTIMPGDDQPDFPPFPTTDPFSLNRRRPNLLDHIMGLPPQGDPPAQPFPTSRAGLGGVTKPSLLDLAMSAPPPMEDGGGTVSDSPFGLPAPKSGGLPWDPTDGTAQGPQPTEGTGQPKLPKLTGPDDGTGSPQANSFMAPPPPTAEDWRRYDAEYKAWVDQNSAILERNKVLKEQGYPPLPVPPPPNRPGERIPGALYLMGDSGSAAADPALTLPKSPFGSSDGADHWAAGNMADALLGKGDYADTVTHYLGQAKADPAGTQAELAAVYDRMAGADPASAAKFVSQMGAAGLADDTPGTPPPQPNPPEATAPPARPEPEDPAPTAGLPAEAADAPSTKGVQVAEADTGTKTDAAPATETAQPTSNNQAPPQIDLDKAAAKLNQQAEPTSQGDCGKYVKAALQAGGKTVGEGIRDAKDMGPALQKAGFDPVDKAAFIPQKGDVVVLQPYPGGRKEGHIAMYDGKQWISDFKQKDMWGGPGYRSSQPPYQIYRSKP